MQLLKYTYRNKYIGQQDQQETTDLCKSVVSGNISYLEMSIINNSMNINEAFCLHDKENRYI